MLIIYLPYAMQQLLASYKIPFSKAVDHETIGNVASKNDQIEWYLQQMAFKHWLDNPRIPHKSASYLPMSSIYGPGSNLTCLTHIHEKNEMSAWMKFSKMQDELRDVPFQPKHFLSRIDDPEDKFIPVFKIDRIVVQDFVIKQDPAAGEALLILEVPNPPQPRTDVQVYGPRRNYLSDAGLSQHALIMGLVDLCYEQSDDLHKLSDSTLWSRYLDILSVC